MCAGSDLRVVTLGCVLVVLIVTSPSSAMTLLTKFVVSGLWNTLSCITFLRGHHVAHKVTANFTKDSWGIDSTIWNSHWFALGSVIAIICSAFIIH